MATSVSGNINCYKTPLRRDIQQCLENDTTSLLAALSLDGLDRKDSELSEDANTDNSEGKSVSERVAMLECHFKWIHELTSVDSDRIANLKEKMVTWIEESTDVYMNVCITVTQRLLLCMYESYLGNFVEALNWTVEVEAAIKEAEETGKEPAENIRAFQYVLYADTLNILCWIEPTKELEDKHQQRIKELMQNIRKIDVNGDSCKAAFLALKGHLVNQLGKTDTLVEICRKVVSLNPNFYYWQYQLYTSLRKKRRENTLQGGPGEEEKQACKSSLKLEGESCWTLLAASQMYEEILRCRTERLTPVERDDMSLLVIQLLESALGSNPNSITINIRLAEVYAYDSIAGKYFDVRKAEELFESCERKWPKNSMVSHKFGKFFINVVRDKERGRLCLEKALEYDNSNFPCLMDYIKLRQQNDTSDQMLKLLDEYIPTLQHKKSYYGKLMILKGLLLWNHNRPVDAIELWLVAFRYVPSCGLQQNLTEILQGQHCMKRIVRPVNIKFLKEQVSLLINKDGFDVDNLKKLEVLLQSIPITYQTQYQNPRPRYNSNNSNPDPGSTDGGHQTWAPRSRKTSESSTGASTDWRSNNNNHGRYNEGEAAAIDHRPSHYERSSYTRGHFNSRGQHNPHPRDQEQNDQVQEGEAAATGNHHNRYREETSRTRGQHNPRGQYNSNHWDQRQTQVGKDDAPVRKRREDQKLYSVAQVQRQRDGIDEKHKPRNCDEDNWRH